jgi:hypothetical protein
MLAENVCFITTEDQLCTTKTNKDKTITKMMTTTDDLHPFKVFPLWHLFIICSTQTLPLPHNNPP